MFERLVSSLDYEIAHRIFKVQIQMAPNQTTQPAVESKTAMTQEVEREKNRKEQLEGRGKKAKLSRNDPCWCGSGKKWKKCHYPEVS
jgi:preprotein translocase subunit SecA